MKTIKPLTAQDIESLQELDKLRKGLSGNRELARKSIKLLKPNDIVEYEIADYNYYNAAITCVQTP